MHEMTDEQPLHSKRIYLAQAFNAIALIGAILGVVTSGAPLEDQTLLSVTITAFASIIFIGQFFLRRDNAAFVMFTVLSIYIWIAYPLKVILVIHDPMSSWVSHQLFQANIVKKEIPDAFYTVIPGIIALFLGFLMGTKEISHDRDESLVLRHRYFLVIILGLMLLKISIQTFLDIGLPGVKPQLVSVPFLTGLLDMLSRPVLFAMVNLYFYCVLRLNEPRGLLLGFCLILINILLAVRVGWKGELVIQGILIAFYLVNAYIYMEPNRRRFVAVAAIAVVVATINLYTLLNEYRNYILSGRTISEAIDKAEDREKKNKSSISFYPIYNRVNGIDAYYAAVKLGRGKDFPLESLLSDNVMDLIKERFYGHDKDKAMTAFGTTQFSVLYLIGGTPFLAVGCFVFGWAFRCMTMLVKNRIFASEITFYACLPFLCILWIKMLSAGGMLSLYFKELILIIGCLYCAERICYRRQKNDATDDQNTVHGMLPIKYSLDSR